MIRNLFILICFGFAASSASAGHTQARLILANETVLPGDTVLAGIQLHMDPGWFTYWRNAGTSGVAPSIKWEQSWSVSAGDIQWPVPEKLTTTNLTSYVYRNDVILLVPVKIAYGVPRGSLDLKATVSWQEFKEQPTPGSAEVHATLSIGRENRPSDEAELLRSWKAKLPQAGGAVSARARWDGVAKSDMRSLILEWDSSRSTAPADFFPYESVNFEVQGATERIPADAGKIRLRKQVKKFHGDWPGQVSGLLIKKTAKEQFAFEVTLPIMEAPESGKAAVTDSADVNHGETSR